MTYYIRLIKPFINDDGSYWYSFISTEEEVFLSSDGYISIETDKETIIIPLNNISTIKYTKR